MKQHVGFGWDTGRWGRGLMIVVLSCAVAGAVPLALSPASVELGRRLQHVVIETEVTLTNTGREPLEIVRVLPDCACAVAEPAEKRLAPGAATTMKVTFDTKNFSGAIHRKIAIQTTAGEVVLPLRAEVTPYADWSFAPSMLVLSPTLRDQETGGTVVVTHLGEGAAEVKTAASNLPWLQASLAPGADGRSTLVNLRKKAGAPVGNSSVMVVLETMKGGKAETIMFTVVVPVASATRVVPNPIVLPSVKAGEMSRAAFRVQGWEGPGAPQVTVAQGEVTSLGELNGEYTFEVALKAPAAGSAMVMVRVADAKEARVEVPAVVRALAPTAPKVP